MLEGVTLVIPAKNAGKTIRACLDAVVPLLGRNGLNEIILVDDGSTDDTAAIAATYPIRVLAGPACGPGGARNVGWRASSQPLIWFIDSDCVAEPDALALLLPYLRDGAVGAVGGSYGNRCSDSMLACLIHEEIIARHERMPTNVDYIATFNVVYRRAALEQVGGFDESQYNGPGMPGAEDIDLAYRLHDARFKMCFEMRSRVGHYHPTRLARYLRSQYLHGYFRVWLYLNHRNRVHGDSYSGLVDHLQPPLAMLSLATVPLGFLGPFFALIPALALLVLSLLQLPFTLRLLRRTGQVRYLTYVPMGFLRAYARGIGMSYSCVVYVMRMLSGRARAPLIAQKNL